MAQEHLRVFIALELSTETKNEAHVFVERIREKYPHFRFIPPQNWHLTLDFLGPVLLDRVQDLIAELPNALILSRPFTVFLQEMGAFPNSRKTRILWLGMKGELEELFALKKAVDGMLRKKHFSIETRNFEPHITIARLKTNERSSIFEPEPFEGTKPSKINGITIFKSLLDTEGATYERLAILSLGEKNSS